MFATPQELLHFVYDMPKAELHIHLEGSIQPATLLELAQRHGRERDLPFQDETGLREWFTFTDFRHFVEIYLTISSLLRTPEDFALITYACGADMAAQNIRYREVTFTPYTHLHLQKKGLTPDTLLAGLQAGRMRAQQEFGVEIRWVFDIPRNAAFSAQATTYDPAPAEETLSYALAGRDQGVVGFGLGGFEVGAPPEPFARAFDAARTAGLTSLPHAGETVGPSSIWGAVDALGAQRLGHGVRAIEDPALLLHLHQRQIPLEVNLTSNICLHVYRRLAEHPFPHLDRMGMLLTVNSDDPPLFNTNLLQEYALLATEFGYDLADIARIARNAFVCSAAPAELRGRLLAGFDAWARTQDITVPMPAAAPPSP